MIILEAKENVQIYDSLIKENLPELITPYVQKIIIIRTNHMYACWIASFGTKQCR